MLFGKRSSPIHLTIPEPCTQAWDNMTKANDGRHCASCNKEVIDFTTMTDRELYANLQKSDTGCGRFYATQLSRPILAPAEPKQKLWMRIALGLMVFLGIAKESRGQNKEVSSKECSTTIDSKDLIIKDTTSSKATDITEIDGTIRDTKGETIPGASITLTKANGDIIGTTSTDIDGAYSIQIADTSVFKNGSLLIIAMGLKDTVTDINIAKGERLRVDHKMGYKEVYITTGSYIHGPSLLQPEGIHKVHKMTGREY